MPESQRLKEAWEFYEAMCVHPAAGERARIAIRSTFYAGISACLQELREMSDLPDAKIEARLNEIQDEMNAFARSEVERGEGERG